MFHQAAFDSLITGLCFQTIRSIVEPQTKKSIFEDSRFVNKFFNTFSFDIPYLTTDPNENIKLDRSNVFYLEFDCEPAELEDNFNDFKNFRIDYLSDNSCLIGISHCDGDKKKMINFIVKNKASAKPLRIETFDYYYENLNSYKEPKREKIMVEQHNIDPTDPLNDSLIFSSSSNGSSQDSFESDDNSKKKLKIEPVTSNEAEPTNDDKNAGLKTVFEESKEWDS